MSEVIAYDTRTGIAEPGNLPAYRSGESAVKVADVVPEVLDAIFKRSSGSSNVTMPSVKASDPTIGWELVRKALEDPRWDFRTVESIARETGLDIASVRSLLDQHESDVRGPMLPDRDGRELFTSRHRARGWREIVHTIQRCVSKSL